MTSTILEIIEQGGVYWLILECGHWYKWTGKELPKEDTIDCPKDDPGTRPHPHPKVEP